ncbi:MAG: DUF5018 domain-containing protein [Bacteroidales bacterium]|nr:DUF5018 domain-containing protein [Bacteroidales bacterium]
MKHANIYIVFAAFLLLVSACAKEVHQEASENANIQTLVVRGLLASDASREFPTVIDETAGTIVVQVPYYLSDTETLQGDLTKMKLSATLPYGAKFSPSIAGVHDLVEGFTTHLEYADGHSVRYFVYAQYVKSDAAQISSIKFADPNFTGTFAIKHPSGNEKGNISVLKTATNAEALKAVIPTVSAWASVVSPLHDEDGAIDISDAPEVVVESQSGKVRAVYTVSFEVPKTVEYGVGYIEALFGWQPTTTNPRGFTVGDNRSMAVVGNYLILSNGSDFTKMPVYNRFSGEQVDVTVNTTGINATSRIFGITTDDAGHLAAITFVSSVDGQATESQVVYGYVWADGIDKAPKPFLEGHIDGGAWTNAPRGVNGATKYEIGRTITVSGDLTTGEAIIATASKNAPRPVFVRVVNGSAQYPAFIQWPSGPGIQVSMWNSTKVKLLNHDKDNLTYLWNSSNFRSNTVYSCGGAGFGFDNPTTHWWPGSSTYDHVTRSLDCIEFNGARLVAITNGLYAGRTRDGANQMYYRCYVADIGSSPAASSLQTGFIFDTREGSLAGTDGIPGSGYTAAGMTSPFAFDNVSTILGPDANECGDVVFARGSDGYSVQLYILTTDQGLIGYNLTSLDTN